MEVGVVIYYYAIIICFILVAVANVHVADELVACRRAGRRACGIKIIYQRQCFQWEKNMLGT